ncbi:MAG: CYTH and CHAD domain-containing protein [Betaproteobacteria bacterium]|nr:CYTH and CHAD domain-containing protein [Betaproteobacteria bacterium]MDE2187615.1 CYTH and CHAD domain-containing protein [Betaproteobacteria bacterium]MDE2325017.1 CYTH and CHAD domain-containing protein [Betaproteobacteria bacterium]
MMGTERELKFSIAALAAQQLPDHPILGQLAGPPRIKTLDSRYFDTEDGLLADAGMALRLRQTGHGRVMTFKTSGVDALGHARGEWEWVAAGSSLEPDSDELALADVQRALRQTPLRDLALPAHTLHARLRPVFGTRFDRMAWAIDWQGSRMELALDRGACLASRGGAMLQAPISEIEIELIDGRWSHCWDLAWALAQDLPLRLSTINKAQRASALRAGERPRAPDEPASLPPDMSLPQAAQLWLSTACAQLSVGAERMETGDATRDVHQFRVTVRRLRTTLRWLQPWTQPRALRWFEAEWRWAMQLAGLVRDADVGLQMLSDGAARLQLAPELASGWSAGLQVERQRQWGTLRAYLHSPRFGRLLLALGRWAETWPAGGPTKAAAKLRHFTLRDLARRAIGQDHKHWRQSLAACRPTLEALARGDSAPLEQVESMVDLHAFRLDSKRLRFSLERLGHALPEVDARRMQALRQTTEALQTLLGNWRDGQRLLETAQRLQKRPDKLAQTFATQAQDALQQAWVLVQQHAPA